jgi:hypothetical protein
MSPLLTPGTTLRAPSGRVLRLVERIPTPGDPGIRYERVSEWDRPGGETGGVCPVLQWLQWAAGAEVVS